MSVIERETVETPAELEQAEDEILILKKARDLLSDRSNWCACHDTLDDDGLAGRAPWEEGVTQRCALSAIAWASGEQWNWLFGPTSPERYRRARERLGREVPGITRLGDRGSSDKIIFLNDGPDGYTQIMAAFERAVG